MKISNLTPLADADLSHLDVLVGNDKNAAGTETVGTRKFTLEQVRRLNPLDVTLADIGNNAIKVTGPALAVTTDGKMVRLPAGTTAGATNPAGNAAFVDYETATELDARDAANRERINQRARAGGRRFETNGSATLAAGSQDFGTNDFALHGVIALDTYTPASAGELWSSHSAGNNRATLSILSNGDWRLSITDDGGSVTNYDFTPPTALTDGATYAVSLVADRDVDATLYLGTQAAVSAPIAASSAVDIGSGNSNAGKLFADANLSGTIRDYTPFNYLLTTAEVDAIHAKGIGPWLAEHPLDQWGDTQNALEDGDMEDAGLTDLTEVTGATATKSTANPHGGAQALRLTSDGSVSRGYWRYKNITPGKVYHLTGWARGDGANGRARLRYTNANDNAIEIFLSTNSTTWQQFDIITQKLGDTSNGTLDFEVRFNDSAVNMQDGDWVEYDDMDIEELGAIASIPFDDGIGFQGRDNSTNHADALASAAGVSHLREQADGALREHGVSVDDTGVFVISSSRDTLPDNAYIYGILFRNADTAVTDGSISVQRSDGSTEDTALVTFASGIAAGVADFEEPEGAQDLAKQRIKLTNTTGDTDIVDVEILYRKIK